MELETIPTLQSMLEIKSKLMDLIRIPSYVDAKQNINESQLGEYIYTFFKNLQERDPLLKVEKQSVEGNRFNVLVYKGDPKILIGFHMDTVLPYYEDWKITNPFEPKEVDNKLFGRGSVDMKAQIAVIMVLIKELSPKLNNFHLLFTVDEEYNFKGVLKFLEKTRIKPGLVIFCEPTDLKISNTHRGIIQLRVTVYGKLAHAGTPNSGINAIEILIEALKEAKEEILSDKFEDPCLGPCSFNLAYLSGGQEGSYNCIPDVAFAVLDIRSTPKLNKETLNNLIKEKIKNKFKQKCQENNLDFDALYKEPKIEYDFVFESLFTEKRSLELLEVAVKKVIGVSEYATLDGVTEAGIISNKLKVPACNFGPGPREMAHKPDEYVNLEDLNLFKEVLSQLLLEK